MNAGSQEAGKGADGFARRMLPLFFAALAGWWPVMAVGSIFMFDAPDAGGIPVCLLFGATVAYGPVYAVSWFLARLFARSGNTAAVSDTRLGLCSGNVPAWFLGLFLVMGVCGGQFACAG
jgi:hypothetical protein